MKCCMMRHYIWVFSVCQSTHLEGKWYTQGEINSLLSALNSKIYDHHLLSLRAVGSFYFVH